MGKKTDKRMTFMQSFVSGGLAGVVSRTFTSPLDVVKILAQVGTKESQHGLRATFANMYRNEGLKAFWKGNGVACARLFPYQALQFASYTSLKKLLADESTGKLSPQKSMLAGAVSGIMATVAVYPLDMAKTRLTVQHVPKAAAKYHGVMDLFKVVYREEGPLAFYSGMSTSIIGVIPFAGGTFMAYEMLERLWHKEKEDMTPLQNFTNGCLAASIAQTFSFPFDTIRKKLQAQSRAVPGDMRPDIEFSGMIDAFQKTIQKDGFRGLWRGTTANLLKVAPYAGLMFAAYEASRRYFIHRNGYTTSPMSLEPIPGIPQDLSPSELQAWKLEHDHERAEDGVSDGH